MVSAASPVLSTSPSPTTIPLSNVTPPNLTDSAVLSGGFNPTGYITFALSNNYGYESSMVVYTDHVPVISGNNTYTTSQGDKPGGYVLPSTGTVTGTYQWSVSYTPDGNNNAAFAYGLVTVSPASPTLSTTAGDTVVIGSSTTLTDSATLSDGYNPGGSITFYLFAPGVTPNVTDSNNVYSDPVTVSGSGSYTTASGTNPGGYLPTATGTYEWVAIYSGDSNNNGATSSFDNEPETVNPLTVTNLQTLLATTSTVTFDATSTDAQTILTDVNSLTAPASPVTITVNLASGSFTGLTASPPAGVTLVLTSSSGSATVQDAMVTSGTSGTVVIASGVAPVGWTVNGGNVTVQGSATASDFTVNGGTVFIASSVAPVGWTVNGGNVTVQGSATASDFTVNGGTVTLANGTIIGGSSAIIVNGGTVMLQGETAQTATNSPTIVVNGGSLVVRNSTIQESTGYAQSAIQINGGTVDLGTTASPGGNTWNVNGTGTLIENTTAGPVPAVGDTFENNGAAIAANFGVVSLSTAAAKRPTKGLPSPSVWVP